MNGNAMYEVAKQRMAEQQRVAQEAREARSRRALARGRHARKERAEEVVTPAIPDFVEEMFKAGSQVPAPRGRHAWLGR